MRITIDYTSAIAQGAGIGRYTRGLVAALANINTSDHFTLYSSEAPTVGRGFPTAPNLRPRVAGLGAHAVGNRYMTILWHRARVPLPIELLAGRADVFHAPDFSLAPTLLARRIVTIHDLAYLIHPECALPSLIEYLHAVVPRAVRSADRIIAVSERTAADLRERLGVPAEKIAVIPLGLEPAFSQPADAARLAAIEARYGLAHPLVLSVGTIEPRKNYERLIEAFALACRAPEGPRMLAFAGRDGWLYDTVYAAVARHGLADRVRFLGYVADAELPALYAAADVVAMPSLYEGFGIPVLEAMAQRTPVLCSDGGSLPEIAGDAALLVPATETRGIADGLVRLCADGALRARLIARGIARARQYTWDAAARAHLALYHAVGEEKRGHSAHAKEYGMSSAGEFEVPAVVPFDLAKTVEALRRRPTSLTDAMVEGEWRRVLELGGRERLVGARQVAADRVAVRALDGALSGEERAEAAAVVTRMLGLAVELAPVAALARADAQVRALYDGLAGLKPPRYPALWVTFASVVPYQQVSLESGIAVMNRVIAMLGTPHEHAGAVYYAFPTAERFLRTDAEELRRCGLSAAKVRTLRSVAERIQSGELTEAALEPLTDTEAEQRLIALPGIGPWSAHLVLLRGLRRLSIFPAGDAGANRNLRLFLDVSADEAPRAGAALVEKLGPYRGYLYFMLLGRSLMARGLIAPSRA